MSSFRWSLLLIAALCIQGCTDSGLQPEQAGLTENPIIQQDLGYWFPSLVGEPHLVESPVRSSPEQRGALEVIAPDLSPYFKVTTAGASITPDGYGHWMGHSTGYQEAYAWGLSNDTYLSITFEGDPVVLNQHSQALDQHILGGNYQLSSASSAAIWGDCGHTVSGYTQFTIWARDVTKTPPVELNHRSEAESANPTSQRWCDTEIVGDTDDGGGAGGGGGGDEEAMDWVAVTCWYQVYYNSDGMELRRDLMYCEAVY